MSATPLWVYWYRSQGRGRSRYHMFTPGIDKTWCGKEIPGLKEIMGRPRTHMWHNVCSSCMAAEERGRIRDGRRA